MCSGSGDWKSMHEVGTFQLGSGATRELDMQLKTIELMSCLCWQKTIHDKATVLITIRTGEEQILTSLKGSSIRILV